MWRSVSFFKTPFLRQSQVFVLLPSLVCLIILICRFFYRSRDRHDSCIVGLDIPKPCSLSPMHIFIYFTYIIYLFTYLFILLIFFIYLLILFRSFTLVFSSFFISFFTYLFIYLFIYLRGRC